MAETDLHRNLMVDLIETLEDWFAADPMTYVSGNLLVFYEPGNRRRHLSPDVLVVRGIPKRARDNFLCWIEGKAPDLVIELTSASTREEDQDDKFQLYQDVLKIPEYFLFDPKAEYMNPPFQGYRLVQGHYLPIDRVEGRLPSQSLGLHLESRDRQLRLYDPIAHCLVPTRTESREEALLASEQARLAAQRAEAAARHAEAGRTVAEAIAERLRKELEELKRKMSDG